MRKKILVLVDYFEPGYKAGGPIKTLKNTFEALKGDHDFYLITRNHDIGDVNPYDTVPTGEWIENPDYHIIYYNDKDITLANIDKAIAFIQPQVIYLGSFFSWRVSLQVILFRKALHKKIVLVTRGELCEGSLAMKPLKKKLYLQVARLFNLYKHIRFHASSNMESEDIKRNVRVKEIIVAPDLVNSKHIRKKDNYHKKQNILKLCFVSRIVENKNLHFCIETVGELVNKNQNVCLDIYGIIESEPYWDKCKQLIQDGHLENIVTYKGALTVDTVPVTFSQYDFFYFATWSENFGHVIFESLSVGTPVILSNTTFWNDMLNEPRWGYIFPLESKESAIAALNTALQLKDEDYQLISNNAVKVASKVALSPQTISQTKQIFTLNS